MPARKMHADEVDTDEDLVRRLLAAQFPHWAILPIEPVLSAGTDNALYRLGDDLVVRLPRIQWAVGQVDKEQKWLPRLAPLLPLPIPVPLALGSPGEGYPWNWSVCRWLEGENATLERITDPRLAATELAQFITTLQRIDSTDGPLPGPAQLLAWGAAQSARLVYPRRNRRVARQARHRRGYGGMGISLAGSRVEWFAGLDPRRLATRQLAGHERTSQRRHRLRVPGRRRSCR